MSENSTLHCSSYVDFANLLVHIDPRQKTAKWSTKMSKTSNRVQAKREELFLQIASKHLGIDTLEAQNMDDLDFHDCAVWNLRDALEAAYNAGIAAGAVAALKGYQS